MRPSRHSHLCLVPPLPFDPVWHLPHGRPRRVCNAMNTGVLLYRPGKHGIKGDLTVKGGASSLFPPPGAQQAGVYLALHRLRGWHTETALPPLHDLGHDVVLDKVLLLSSRGKYISAVYALIMPFAARGMTAHRPCPPAHVSSFARAPGPGAEVQRNPEEIRRTNETKPSSDDLCSPYGTCLVSQGPQGAGVESKGKNYRLVTFDARVTSNDSSPSHECQGELQFVVGELGGVVGLLVFF